MSDLNEYLYSNNFKKLCYALDISQEDTKQEIYNLIDKTSIALIIYNQIWEKNTTFDKCPVHSNEIWKVIKDYEYYFQIFNPYYKETFDMTVRSIKSGKINSFYLLDKYLKNLLFEFTNDRIEFAKITILILAVKSLINKKRLSDTSKKFLINQLFIEFKDNPLFYDSISDYYEKTSEHLLSFPSIKVRDFPPLTFSKQFLIIEDNYLANFIDDLISKSCDKYNRCDCDYLLVTETHININGSFFQVFACGVKRGGSIVFKERFDDSYYLINRNLILDLLAVEVNRSSKYSYVFNMFDIFDKYGIGYTSKEERSIDYNNFKLRIFSGNEDDEKYVVIDELNKKPYENIKPDENNLVEMISQKEFTPVFYELIDLLKLDLDFAYELQNQVISKNLSENQIIDILNDKIEFKPNDLVKSILPQNKKSNILHAQIVNLLEFREITNEKYIEKLAVYAKDADIINNHIPQYLNQIIGDDMMGEQHMKYYLDVGKFAAPRWLMYPELSLGTIGWRMGYGEAYAMSIPFETEEFERLFPKPLNWLCHMTEDENGARKLDKYSLLARFWIKDGIPRYSKINEEDYIIVNDFITIDQVDGEFRLNAMHFSNIRNYILHAKYDLFSRPHDRHDSTNLNDDFELTESQQELWNHYKYSACLNGAYYKIMEDDELKQTLLDTGDKSLVYISDDEWGSEENLFGFALMELRDEIRRLYKNNDKIDWGYSEYLVHNPRY